MATAESHLNQMHKPAAGIQSVAQLFKKRIAEDGARTAARRKVKGAWEDVSWTQLAAESEYGLSLGILTRDVMRGLELARQIPTGIVHINEQTVDDEPNIPFGGLGASGTGARFGGTSNLEAFTDTRWVTIRGDIAPYPF